MPLFLIDCDTGELRYLSALASYINELTPIYALPAVPAGEVRLGTVEGMATRMVQMIRSVQPFGPYQIAGWSFGGILAYEIATQLIGINQDVRFLGLIDTPYDPWISDSSKEPKEQLDDRKQLLYLSQTQTIGREDSMYSAQGIPIPVHLFASEQSIKMNLTPRWNVPVPHEQLRTITIPGTCHSMLKSPNVQLLGDAISQAIQNAFADSTQLREKDYYPLVMLQAGSNSGKASLFCVPGAGDNVTRFIELADNLDKRWVIYGFQPRGLDGALVPYSTVSTASQVYLSSIKEMCSKGQIHLLGHSFGGWVVFDMAQQLLKEGCQISSLIILDSEAPDSQDTPIREYSRMEVIMHIIGAIEMDLERSLGISQVDINLQDYSAQIEVLHNALVREGIMSRRSEPDTLYGPLRTFAMALRTRYIPNEIYHGAIQLVLADDQRLDQAANQKKYQQTVEEWKKWAPNVTHVKAPGNHMTLLKGKNLHELVKLLRFC
ncbi:MAG TPA: alpha/beta fold hydrolase [Acidobacteriaceae bacterium]|nr:alpha/beta fold hydrolase [Acidobacteriaceae bacterium]